jgi:hypothetical protein
MRYLFVASEIATAMSGGGVLCGFEPESAA